MTGSGSAAGRKRKADGEGPPSLGRPEDDVLTTAQVAQVLHVTTRTLMRLIQDGTVIAHRLPGTRKFLFLRHEIMRLIEDSVVKPGELDPEGVEKAISGGE